MIKNLTFTNMDIYTLATSLIDNFTPETYLPVNINFYFKRNKNTIVEVAQVIDDQRNEIIKKYGTYIEEKDQYEVPEDKIDEAQKELSELFAIKQQLPIYLININKFDKVELNALQSDVILFMVYDPEEEQE